MFCAAKAWRRSASGAIADAAADQDRARGPGRKLLGSREGVAERTVDPDLLTRLQLTEPIGPRPDALDEEIEVDALGRRGRFGNRESTGQEGAAVPLVPVGPGGEHVELAGLGFGALLVDQGEEPVAARGLALGDRAEATPEGGGHRGCFALSRPWISCSDWTSASPSILAAMARTAAVAPVIVVTQGMP